jgi:hypothetical protein
MMVIVAVAAGEHRPHRSTADHDTEAERNCKLTNLIDFADFADPG